MQWTKNGKTLENTGMAADESQKQEVIDEAKKEGKTVPLRKQTGSLSSKELGVGTKISKV